VFDDDRFTANDMVEMMREAGDFKGMDLNNPKLPQQQTLGEALEADRTALQGEIDATPAPVEPAPVPTAEPATPAAPAEPPVPQQATIPEYEIPAEDLDKYYTMGNVYGEEKKYTLRDLTNINQTQDAASSQLEEYKSLVREYKDLAQRPAAPPQEVPEPEYLTDEERHIRTLETKVDQLTQLTQKNEADRNTEAENAYVLHHLNDAGLSQDDFGSRVNTMLEANPKLKHYAEEVFTKVPQNRADLESRQGMFDLLLTNAKSMETPQVVKTTRDTAFREGQVAAQLDAKRNLTNVETGVSQPSEPSRADMISKASELDNDDAWAELVLKTGMFKE